MLNPMIHHQVAEERDYERRGKVFDGIVGLQ
jgi:hypothetical protein